MDQLEARYPVLAEDFRVIAPDMAGFSYTERNPDLAYDIKLWVKHSRRDSRCAWNRACQRGREQLRWLFGACGAARFPERFERLVLMGTPCDKFLMTPGLRAGWFYTPDREVVRQTMAHFPHDPSFITDELVDELVDDYRATAGEVEALAQWPRALAALEAVR